MHQAMNELAGRDKRSVPGGKIGNGLRSCAGLRRLRAGLKLANGNDFDADSQLGPDAIGGVHGLLAGKSQRETGTVSEALAQPPGIGFEPCSCQCILSSEWCNFDVHSLDVTRKFIRGKAVSPNARRHFREVDARYAGGVDNFGDNRGTGLIEQHAGNAEASRTLTRVPLLGAARL